MRRPAQKRASRLFLPAHLVQDRKTNFHAHDCCWWLTAHAGFDTPPRNLTPLGRGHLCARPTPFVLLSNTLRACQAFSACLPRYVLISGHPKLTAQRRHHATLYFCEVLHRKKAGVLETRLARMTPVWQIAGH